MEAERLSDPQPSPFELALRIRHPSLDPTLISKELKLLARHSFKAGQQRQPPTNLAPPSYHAESYWLGALDPATFYQSVLEFDTVPRESDLERAQERLKSLVMSDLDAALSWCVRFLRAHGDFLRRIPSEGGQIYLLVTLSNIYSANFTLGPDISRMLGELGVSINFEFSVRD